MNELPTVKYDGWYFFTQKLKGGNACGRKGSIRDMQSDRQLHRCGADRIHCDRDKLRHAGSTPRHSSNQPELLLPEASDRKEDYREKNGPSRGRRERAISYCVGIEVKVELAYLDSFRSSM